MMRPKRRLPYVCLPVAGQSFWNSGQPDSRRTALREAAYIRRTKFENGETIHDFSCRAEDLFMMTPIVPVDAPTWARRPFLRWKLADDVVHQQNVANTVRAWHVCADLPQHLSRGRWVDDAEAIVRSNLPARAIAEICGHAPVNQPAHVHILVSARLPLRHRYGAGVPHLEEIINERLRSAWLEWLEAESVSLRSDYRKAA